MELSTTETTRGNGIASCLFEPCDIIEIRRLPGGESTWTTGDRLMEISLDGQGIYFGANPRSVAGDGTSARDCTGSNCGRCHRCVMLARAVFADLDGITAAEANHRLSESELPPPTLTVSSGGGIHFFWRLDLSIKDLERWSDIQRGIARVLNSDAKVVDPPRIMRMPGSTNHKYDPPRPCVVLECEPERVYSIADLDWVVESKVIPDKPLASRVGSGKIQSGDRNDTLFRLGCSMRAKGCGEESILAALVSENAERCDPPLSDCEVRQVAGSSSNYDKGVDPYFVNSSNSSYEPKLRGKHDHALGRWPKELAESAYHGAAGEFVRRILPHTEADPAALLLSLLVGFGSIIGKNAHFLADGAKHSLNLFAVLVGKTAKGRKGTSWSHIQRLLERMESEFTEKNLVSGLSSGEGLIWQVRDPIYRKRQDRKSGNVEEELVDEGVEDKRLLVQESEFATVLRVSMREGNTITAVLRQAWDSGSLNSLTKNSPAKATGAHISLVGHITQDDLLRFLDATEAANGFGNRILWVCTKRSKVLPEGGKLEGVNFADLDSRFAQAVEFGCRDTTLIRDPEARDLWIQVYPNLSEGKPGLSGSLTSRAEAQAMRLAAIYAVLDCSALIKLDHLRAGLAVWSYCERSVDAVFGKTIGDPVADDIHKALVGSPDGMTRTEISNYFGRNRKSHQIGRALEVLQRSRMASPSLQATDGRSIERWFATPLEYEIDEFTN